MITVHRSLFRLSDPARPLVVACSRLSPPSTVDDTHARFAADSSGAAWDVATSSAARAAQHLDTLHPRAFAHGSNTTSTSHAPLPPPPQLPPPPPPGSFNMEWFDHPTYGPPSSHIAPQQAYHPYYYQHSLHRLHPYYHLRLSGSQHHPVDAPGAGPSSHLPPPSWMSSYSPATAPPPASSHPHQAYRHALDVYQYLYPHHPLPPHPAMDLTEAPFDPRAGFTSHPSQRLSDPSSSISNGHRVYLLSCRHCALPFSDRGMRAVLLLRPNITLFSTDAVPSHIGPLPTPGVQTDNNEDARTPASSSVRSSRREDEPERTCDCLTQVSRMFPSPASYKPVKLTGPICLLHISGVGLSRLWKSVNRFISSQDINNTR